MCWYCCIPHAKLSVFQPFTFVFWMPLLQIFLNKCPNLRKKLLVPCILDPPSANCYVCVSKPEVTVKLNVHKTMVLSLQDRVNWSACFLHRPATMKEMLIVCIHIDSELLVFHVPCDLLLLDYICCKGLVSCQVEVFTDARWVVADLLFFAFVFSDP